MRASAQKTHARVPSTYRLYGTRDGRDRGSNDARGRVGSARSRRQSRARNERRSSCSTLAGASGRNETTVCMAPQYLPVEQRHRPNRCRQGPFLHPCAARHSRSRRRPRRSHDASRRYRRCGRWRGPWRAAQAPTPPRLHQEQALVDRRVVRRSWPAPRPVSPPLRVSGDGAASAREHERGWYCAGASPAEQPHVPAATRARDRASFRFNGATWSWRCCTCACTVRGLARGGWSSPVTAVAGERGRQGASGSTATGARRGGVLWGGGPPVGMRARGGRRTFFSFSTATNWPIILVTLAFCSLAASSAMSCRRDRHGRRRRLAFSGVRQCRRPSQLTSAGVPSHA